MRFRVFAVPCLSLILAGCGSNPASPVTTPPPTTGVAIRGSAHSGTQPIAGAHVYLLAANTTGYGSPSISLLNDATAGASDALGAYVTTDSTGSFSIPADYTCAANAQTYLYASGGNAGSGANSAIALLAALGNCPSTTVTTPPTVWINEVSTVAAAYAISGFATDATHVSSSGTTLAQTGIAHAFLNSTNLANLSTGTALGATPAGNGAVPQPEINMLANLLVACTSSTGPASSGCSTLFANTLSAGTTGAAPANTANAILNVAHNPASNVATLYNLAGTNPAFFPNYTGIPPSFVVSLVFIYPGINLAYNSAFTSPLTPPAMSGSRTTPATASPSSPAPGPSSAPIPASPAAASTTPSASPSTPPETSGSPTPQAPASRASPAPEPPLAPRQVIPILRSPIPSPLPSTRPATPGSPTTPVPASASSPPLARRSTPPPDTRVAACAVP